MQERSTHDWGSGRLTSFLAVCLYSPSTEVTDGLVIQTNACRHHSGGAKTLTSHVDTYAFLLRRSEHSQLRSRDVDQNGSTALQSMW